MSYPATVYKVFIASPNDVVLERNMIRQILTDWNTVNSQLRGIVLLPIGWETHTSPEMGDRPQSIIDRQILRDCDLLIGVFWTRLGTPTEGHESGTVEEIEKHVASNKTAMLYFSAAPVALESVDHAQYERLTAFRESTKSRGLFETYTDLADFSSKLTRQLQLKINQNPSYFIGASGSQGGVTPLDSFLPPPNIPTLAREAQVLLKAAAHDPAGVILYLKRLADTVIQISGKNFIEQQEPRVVALWAEAMKELEAKKLIESAGAKGEIFKVTAEGFRVADLLGP
jgi:Domain of unknown function (DUF4062)